MTKKISKMNRKELWEYWAGEAHNALFQLREIQEEIEGEVDMMDVDEDGEPSESIQNLIELDVSGALETAEAADDSYDI